ncbi:hypothetical protein SESBI_12805 [Sesbania bispinosa]|nr:hypothetical protein SESBI_12805 [Sesbania bispinosa]
MASANLAAKKTENTSVSVSSPSKVASNLATSNRSLKSSTGLPPAISPNFTSVVDETQAIGNRRYESMMTQLNYFGHFMPRSRKAIASTLVTMLRATMCDAIQSVLNCLLERLLPKTGHRQQTKIVLLADSTATTLTHGCMLMVYRIRSLHRSYPTTYSNFMIRPGVPEPFDIPVPYALAIQSLGLFRVSSKTYEEEGPGSSPVQLKWSPVLASKG